MKYNDSEEYKQEKQFIELSKNKAIRNYLKVNNSEILERFQEIELSGKPARFLALKSFVESPEYKAERKLHRKENSDEYQRELEYIGLKKDSEVKQYFKLKNWAPLNDYFLVKDSEILRQYNSLQSLTLSEDFQKNRAYLLSKDKFNQSEEFKKLSEYQQLTKSEKIKWFYSLENTKKFDDIKRWKLVFSDDFSENNLNNQKWITRYFWGDALLSKTYTLAADKHWYTESKNIHINESILKISTKKEKAEGMAWHLTHGFIPKGFDYTSGIINSGSSFRQKNGRFEAKVRFSCVKGLYHAFWLVGDQMLPHINVFRFEGKSSKPSIQGSLFWQNGTKKKASSCKTTLSGFEIDKEFFILGVDWTPSRIVWKINGIPYLETSNNLPEIPAYLVISSGVIDDADDSMLPATFEVDWVKCWKEV